MRSVGIYRSFFPLGTEAFITEQARSLQRYEPRMVVRRYLGGSALPVVAPRPSAGHRLRDLVFALTADPLYFHVGRGLAGLHLIHAHFGPDGVYAMRLAQYLDLPFLVSFHGFDAPPARRTLARGLRPAALCYLMHRTELRRSAGAFIAVSRFIQEGLIRHGFPEDKVRLHYTGVDTGLFTPAPASARPPFLLCVAEHVERKGIDVLLRAFARIAGRFPQVELVLAGGGPLTPGLQVEAAGLGLAGRARFLGPCPAHEVLRLLQDAYAFVLPCRTAEGGDSEGLGMIFLEASACGRPVVATVHGGIPEVVRHGETGLLAPENDPEALAGHLAALLEDRALAEEMGRRGREFVCDQFDLFRQTAKLELIYDEILDW